MIGAHPESTGQPLSISEQFVLIDALNTLPLSQFLELEHLLNMSPDTMLGIQADQGLRTRVLLKWVEGPTGPGLETLLKTLQNHFGRSIIQPHQPTSDAIDSLSSSKRLSMAIAGRLDEIDVQTVRAILDVLRQTSQDRSIEIVRVEKGIILDLSGTPEGLEGLKESVDSGMLSEILDFSVDYTLFSEPSPPSTCLNLSGADFSGADFSGIVFSGVDLSAANLSGADLSGADLSGAVLGATDLSDANLSDANLSGADLIAANLSGAVLTNADLSGAVLSTANLSSALLNRANLSDAILIATNLSGAVLSRANVSRAFLNRADSRGAFLSGANFSGANLSNTNLCCAVLDGTRMVNCVNLTDSERTLYKARGAILGDSLENSNEKKPPL